MRGRLRLAGELLAEAVPALAWPVLEPADPGPLPGEAPQRFTCSLCGDAHAVPAPYRFAWCWWGRRWVTAEAEDTGAADSGGGALGVFLRWSQSGGACAVPR